MSHNDFYSTQAEGNNITFSKKSSRSSINPKSPSNAMTNQLSYQNMDTDLGKPPYSYSAKNQEEPYDIDGNNNNTPKHKASLQENFSKQTNIQLPKARDNQSLFGTAQKQKPEYQSPNNNQASLQQQPTFQFATPKAISNDMRKQSSLKANLELEAMMKKAYNTKTTQTTTTAKFKSTKDPSLQMWRTQWSQFMKGAKIYFDDISVNKIEKVRPTMDFLECSAVDHFDSEVNVLVTNKPLDVEYKSSHVISQAKERGCKVWLYEKFCRVLKNICGELIKPSPAANNNATTNVTYISRYTPSTTTSTTNNTNNNGGLASWLKDEHKFVVNPNLPITTERDAALASSVGVPIKNQLHADEFVKFSGPYQLVWDPKNYYRPFHCIEFPKVDDLSEAEWPQLQAIGSGRSPFVTFEKKNPTVSNPKTTRLPQNTTPVSQSIKNQSLLNNNKSAELPEPKRRKLVDLSHTTNGSEQLATPIRQTTTTPLIQNTPNEDKKFNPSASPLDVRRDEVVNTPGAAATTVKKVHDSYDSPTASGYTDYTGYAPPSGISLISNSTRSISTTSNNDRSGMSSATNSIGNSATNRLMRGASGFYGGPSREIFLKRIRKKASSQFPNNNSTAPNTPTKSNNNNNNNSISQSPQPSINNSPFVSRGDEYEEFNESSGTALTKESSCGKTAITCMTTKSPSASIMMKDLATLGQYEQQIPTSKLVKSSPALQKESNNNNNNNSNSLLVTPDGAISKSKSIPNFNNCYNTASTTPTNSKHLNYNNYNHYNAKGEGYYYKTNNVNGEQSSAVKPSSRITRTPSKQLDGSSARVALTSAKKTPTSQFTQNTPKTSNSPIVPFTPDAFKRDGRGGHCENCHEMFTNYQVHVTSLKHRKMAKDTRHWEKFDALLKTLQRPRRSSSSIMEEEQVSDHELLEEEEGILRKRRRPA